MKNTASDGLNDMTFEKSIMVLNKERDICFKCKYYCPKSENEGMDFKCKKWKTS